MGSSLRARSIVSHWNSIFKLKNKNEKLFFNEYTALALSTENIIVKRTHHGNAGNDQDKFQSKNEFQY